MSYFELIRQPHSFAKENNYIFFGQQEDNDIFQGVGLEIEFDDPNTRNREDFRERIAEKILSIQSNHFKVEKDSSLVAGIELITQPHSIDEMRKFFTSELKEILEEMIEVGAKDFAYTTGVHFHLSKTVFGKIKEQQKDSIAKIWYLYANNKELMMKIGHRQKERQCACPDTLTPSEAKEKVENEFDSYARKIRLSKFQAINLKHLDTVEFRMFQGTTNLYLLTFWLEFIWHVANKALHMSWNDAANINSWLEGSPSIVLKNIKNI